MRQENIFVNTNFKRFFIEPIFESDLLLVSTCFSCYRKKTFNKYNRKVYSTQYNRRGKFYRRLKMFCQNQNLTNNLTLKTILHYIYVLHWRKRPPTLKLQKLLTFQSFLERLRSRALIEFMFYGDPIPRKA